MGPLRVRDMKTVKGEWAIDSIREAVLSRHNRASAHVNSERFQYHIQDLWKPQTDKTPA